jgi:ubiquinone/menaquinone biosynthesis C-methylase UbiE
MHLAQRLFASIYDPVMAPLEHGRVGGQRAELLADAHGHVLDLGAGTGANLEHLPATVARVTAVEPDAAMRAHLQQHLARLTAAEWALPDVEVVDAVAEALPLPDASVDVAITTLVLCTVRDPELAVSELRRVLRSTGRLIVLEHVLSHRPGRQRLQRTLTPAWRIVARGCHLDRDTRGVLAAGGFDVAEVVPWQLSDHSHLTAAITGTARPA